MKNKALKVIILSIILVLFLQVTSFAALGKLTLKVKTDKNSYKVGEKVTVTVDWTKEVEAAGFALKYDKTKLDFASTSLGSNFYNAEIPGRVLFNWAAFDGKALTKVSFVFTAKAEGTSKILLENARGFADENLEQATSYEYLDKTIKILKTEDNKVDEPTTDDKENQVVPNKPGTGNNKNEVIEDKPIDEGIENEVIPDKPNQDEEKNETIVDNENKEDKDIVKLTRQDLITIIIISILRDLVFLVLILILFKRKKHEK